MKKIIKFLISLFIAFIVVIIMTGSYLFFSLSEKLEIKNDIYVTVKKNSTLNNSIRAFNSHNLLRPYWFYKTIARIYTYSSSQKFYAGTYRFTKENTNFDLLRSLFTGRQLSIVRVTYPEGITLAEFASLTSRKLGTDSSEFIRLSESDSLLGSFGIKARTAEGYLMPDTYEFFWNHSAQEIITTLLAAQKKKWEEKFAEKATRIGWKKHDVLTLASIIEAEARVPEEKSSISGVYHNRLKKGWKLEADPTVQYILNHKASLKYKDLETDNLYNTYIYKGLPPGPINSPSLGSIEAALKPDKHDFLFFVAIGDGSGRHSFSKSFAAHQYNKKILKRNLKINR